jgi:hypothetical protein
MGLRLFILGLWTPNYVIKKELEKLSTRTTNSLRDLLNTHTSMIVNETTQNKPTQRSIKEKRAAMAKQHKVLVESLVATVGRDAAVKLGREALFKVGKQLGEETSNRLGVGDSREDLAKAARILYRVLGISFKVEWQNETNATLIVDRCELAKDYSELTCIVLSATDEGVINGLNPNLNMKFINQLTSGCTHCTAKIELKAGQKKK